MKCISKLGYRIISIILIAGILSGCSATNYPLSYSIDADSSFTLGTDNTEARAKTFASNLCVSENNLNVLEVSIAEAEAGGLFDATIADTVYAKNIHGKMNPASLTKVMTALIALKYGHLEDTLTASSNVYIKESGAQLLGLNEGDKMTLDQALYALLLYSANDAAVIIAEYLSGSVESFAAVMNEEAKKLGATNSNFVNPHGLTDENHYTTVYDLYLIMNEAMKYEQFRKIINTDKYTLSYKDREGNSKSKEISNTNSYLTGEVQTPDNITVIGGKTGTTKAAGACLILLSNSDNGHTYISVILHSTDHDSLYRNMTALLNDAK